MSRSALSRKENVNVIPQAASTPVTVPISYQQQPVPPNMTYQYSHLPYNQYPVGFPIGMVAPMVVQMPGLPPMMYPALQPEQSYAPIPLSGDDEDNDPESKPKNILPCYGNTENHNLNNLLHNNILQHEYFRALYQLRTYHEVLHEIKVSVTHVEPWQTGTTRIPSTAFCLLLKLMLMKVTYKQMEGILDYESSPYVRAIGFLYLRYTCPPTDLWKWFEPYLEDEEEILPSSNREIQTTIGKYCVKLLTDMNYYGTTLPRIPVPVERKIRVMLLLLDQKKDRRKNNLKAYKENGQFKVGSRVRAIYSDSENEPAWYEAVINSIDENDDTKFWVTFPEYGNQECVDLGDMALIISDVDSSATTSREGGERGREGDRRRNSRSRSREKDRDDRRRNRSRSRSRERERERESTRDTRVDKPDDLMLKVLQSSQEASAAVGKQYGQRPASYKGSLSLKMDRFTVRRKSPSRSPDPRRGHGGSRESRDNRGQVRGSDRSRDNADGEYTSSSSHGYGSQMQQQSGGGATMSKEYQDKMKRLKERYGDASATGN